MSEQPAFATPSQEHASLKELVGTWNVECTYFMDPSQPPMTCEATDTAEMIGEFWIQSTFESNMFGMPFRGVATLGYNAITEEWVSTWVDSLNPYLFHFTGKHNAESQVLEMSGKGPNPMGSGLCDYRTVEKRISADERHFEMFLTLPEAGEVQLFSYIYRRA